MCTRFDSTLNTFESIRENKNTLQRIQERGQREPDIWPQVLYFTNEDFLYIEETVEIHKPICLATKQLSAFDS